MGAHRLEGALASCGNVAKCFCINSYSKCSVDELFMHYFHNPLSASGGLVHRPPPGTHPRTPLGDFGPQTLNLPTPEKNPAGAHTCLYFHDVYHLISWCACETSLCRWRCLVEHYINSDTVIGASASPAVWNKLPPRFRTESSLVVNNSLERGLKTYLFARAYSPIVVGRSVWNSLPDYLRDSGVGRDKFRQHLKTFTVCSLCTSVYSALEVLRLCAI